MSNIAKAIKNINNNAEFSILENDVNQITWLNGTTPISVADINAKVSEIETAKTNEENQKATDKANGNQKLLDLGLTQAEATALTGYTPPVAE
jgi:hypothetical protein